jgi:hypothetical protein
MDNYNQNTDTYLSHACTIVTLLNVMKYKFGLVVYSSFIMKLAIFFDKLWKRIPWFWAYFDIIYNSFVNQMNKKLDLNFELIKTTVYKINSKDTWTYWFWTPKYSKVWKNAMIKHKITNANINDMERYTWKSVPHNMARDWSMWGYLINTNWDRPSIFTLSTLVYAAKKWVIWSPLRTIAPADTRTKAVCELTISMLKAELRWELESFMIHNKEKPYYDKALDIFFYWRKDLQKMYM